MADRFVTPLPLRKYQVVYHRIPAIMDMLTEKKRSESPNLAFGVPTGRWAVIECSGGNVSIARVERPRGIGTKSLEVVSGAAGNDSSAGYFYQFFNIATDVYTFSFWRE